MNWTAISTISELIGAIVVVLTLFYVAVQIRQHTNATRASTRQGLLDADLALISEFMQYAIDPHLINDEVELTPEDERRFTWMLVKAIRIREFAWHQYQSGNLDEESWESYMAPVPGLFSSNRAKEVLNFYTGSPEFVRLVVQRVDSVEV